MDKPVPRHLRMSAGPLRESRAGPDAQGVSGAAELLAALSSCRSAFFGVGLLSAMINILMLTGAFFMLQIYDRVLPSGSVPTLVALAILVAGLYTVQAILDLIRRRILVRIAASLDEDISGRVYESIIRMPLMAATRSDGLQPLRDLDAIRSFLSGLGPTALFDLPWVPVYLAIIFAFHPMLGFTALFGAVILVVLTVLTDVLTWVPSASATDFAVSRNGLAEASRRNAEAVAAMGMAGQLGERWRGVNRSYVAHQQIVSDVTGGFGSVSRVLRLLLQSAVIAVGAYFVLKQEATAGIIIAGAILVNRALAPIDLAIAHWRGLVAARQSWQRLKQLFKRMPVRAMPMALRVPRNSLSVETASAVSPDGRRVIVHNASFSLKAGDGLGIIGPSGSGKSSLVRLLVGVWQPITGKINIDGAAPDQWGPESLGRHVGYLPQDVELFAGTVADNIARFETDADSTAILAAAEAAGVHDLIVALPNGYGTEIGVDGAALSAGQRQRVALARALYRDPFLMVLDEPGSNLDAQGMAALTTAVKSVRARGGIVILVAHNHAALEGVGLILAMNKGAIMAFGPRDDVLAKVVKSDAATSGELKVIKGRMGDTP